MQVLNDTSNILQLQQKQNTAVYSYFIGYIDFIAVGEWCL